MDGKKRVRLHQFYDSDYEIFVDGEEVGILMGFEDSSWEAISCTEEIYCEHSTWYDALNTLFMRLNIPISFNENDKIICEPVWKIRQMKSNKEKNNE